MFILQILEGGLMHDVSSLVNLGEESALSFQGYVPLNPNVKVKCFLREIIPIQYLSWFG